MGKYLFGAAGPAAPYGTASLLEVLPFEQGAPCLLYTSPYQSGH